MLRTGIHGRDTFALPLYMKRALFDLGGEREPEALSPPHRVVGPGFFVDNSGSGARPGA
jgi:hypothetical protein